MITMLRQLRLRTRLALGYSLFFAAVLMLLIAGIYWVVRNALLDEVAQEIAATTDVIQQDFLASDGLLETYFSDPEAALRAVPPHIEGLELATLYVQVRDLDGTVVVASRSLGGQRLPLEATAQAAALAGGHARVMSTLGPGQVMQLVVPLITSDAVVGLLQVAQPLRAVDQTLRFLLISLLLTALMAVAAAVRGGMWMARRSLQPVEEIAQMARQIMRASDLERRVSGVANADEVGELTTTINEMLARLEQLFTAQRRFVADVSHELRTPLAAMRGHLELLQRGVAHDAAGQAAMTADLLREVNRLTRMANDLLLLAQAEVGLQLRSAPLALDELVLEVVRELQPMAVGVSLRPQFAEQVALKGDRDRLKQALLNLVANALQYTPPGGSVVVALEQDGQAIRLHVRDTGPGIAADDLAHVFERFYRADRARAQRAGGAGIGLAIVKWVAEAHGGNVSVESDLGHGTTFTMLLPLPIETEAVA